MDLGIDAHALVADMYMEVAGLRRELHRTPKWRKIKRYRLFEKIEKLEEDRGLIEHVMLDQ